MVVDVVADEPGRFLDELEACVAEFEESEPEIATAREPVETAAIEPLAIEMPATVTAAADPPG